MHTPIAAFPPIESPLCPGSGGDGEDVLVAGGIEIVGEELALLGGGIEIVDEELAVLAGANKLRDEVVSDAAENAAKSELCHQIGIPSPYMLYNPVPIIVVLALPWTKEFWKMAGEKYGNVAPDMMFDRHWCPKPSVGYAYPLHFT